MSEDFICAKHPHRMTEWDGYVYVCPACVTGEPSDVKTDDEITEGDGN